MNSQIFAKTILTRDWTLDVNPLLTRTRGRLIADIYTLMT